MEVFFIGEQDTVNRDIREYGSTLSRVVPFFIY